MMVHDFDPIFVDFGILQIRWYSMAYIFGILIGWWYGKILLKKQTLGANTIIYLKNFDDLIGYLILGIIVGGRLGYVVFYDPSFYISNFLEIFKLWNGGMSFHGGLIGVIITTYIFSNLKNLNYKIYFDTLSCAAPIGIFLGRLSNFLNSELYGIPTEKPWAVIFPKIDNLTRHPSQLYEALLEGLVLFFILNFFIRKRNLGYGFVSSLFLILYGIFRIISEQFRAPDEHLGYIFQSLSMGSLLSISMIVFGLVFLLKINFNEKNR